MQFYAVLRTPEILEFQKTKPEGTRKCCVSSEETSFLNLGVYPPWYECRKTVTTVRFLDKISPVYTDWWFRKFEHLKDFDKTNLDLSRTISMNSMLESCYDLETLDLSDLDVSNVEDFSYLFANCSTLENIDFTGWNTSKGRFFDEMFLGCCQLEQLDLSSFTAQNARSIVRMFSRCYNLREIIWPNFKSRKKLPADNLFFYCRSLESLDLSNIIVQNTTCIYSTKDLKYLSTIKVSTENLSTIVSWLN